MKNTHKWILTALACLLGGSLMAEPDDSAQDDFAIEPLRDPFWSVGYQPDGWQSARSNLQAQVSVSGSDWEAPASMIRVSGTSRMGRQLAAIINGDIKEVGDLVLVQYNGRTYKWKLKGVNANGKVSLERVGVSNPAIGF